MLFAIGILALGYFLYALIDARIFQARQTREFEESLRPSAVDARLNEVAKSESRDGAPASQSEVSAAGGITSPPLPGSVLGRIEIKRIGIAVMILEGVNNRELRRAVGHIPETAMPGQRGNIGIAGHRDTFFRDLRNIAKHDDITLTTSNGTFHYVVDFSEVTEPDDTEVLEPSSEATLTLVTCYPFYYVGPAPKRLIVRAHQIPDALVLPEANP